MSYKVHHPRKHGRRYPWERWFAQGTFTLTKGVDYDGRTDTMAQQVRQQAWRRRVGVRLRIDDVGTIYVTVTWRKEL